MKEMYFELKTNWVVIKRYQIIETINQLVKDTLLDHWCSILNTTLFYDFISFLSISYICMSSMYELYLSYDA